MANSIRICRGNVSLANGNIVKISYSGFTGIPTVVATVLDSMKNGNNVTVRNKTISGCTLAAFYNGGLMLTEGSVEWIAVGPCRDEACTCGGIPHKCNILRVYSGG